MNQSMKTGMTRWLIAAVLMSSAATALAQVTAADAWVRATVARQGITGAFMRLSSPADARLVSASTPLAGAVELHRMSMADNVMRMTPVSAIDIPAGKGVELKPGGYHLMLIDLKSQIKAGDIVPISLVIEAPNHQRSTLTVKAIARALGAGSGMGAMPMK